MKSFFALFLFLTGLSPVLYAQGENNVWCFGDHRSLDFNGPAPVAGTSKIRVFEGSASVCGEAGDLLFYMGSDTVWDRNHHYMPNGTGISGNYMGSGYKGIGIIRFPFDPFKYFLVTTDAIEQGGFNAYYSVVDMSLNGGLGDIVPGQKNIVLDTNVTEGVNLLPMSGCGGHWIVLHRKGNKDFLAYRVDANGIAASPVVSQGALSTPAFSNAYGLITNTAGNGIAATSGETIELASFDNSTGQVFNVHTLDTAVGYLSFSPDDSRLFVSNEEGLYQVNLSLMPNMTAVLGSLVLIDTGRYYGFRLGPDQKLYTVRWEATPSSLGIAIARMHTPNAIGTAVTLERNFVPATAAIPFYELGNPAAVLHFQGSVYSWRDTVICTAPPVTLQGDPGYQSFLWYNGSTEPHETFTQEGVYWLRGIKNCVIYMDSFRLRFQQLQFPLLGPDTDLCRGDSLVLAPTEAGPLYRWQDGSMAPSYTVAGAGLFTVVADSGACKYYDSIRVRLLEPSIAILQPDTSICAGTVLTLKASATPEGSMQWSNGEQGNAITITQEGIYTVTTSNVCGAFNDTVAITTEDCDCRAFIPNAFSPNDDGNNDRLRVRLDCWNMTEYDFSLYNRYGQRVFHSSQPEQEWNGDINGGKADVGTYFYYLKYKSSLGKTMVRKGDITLLR